MAGGEKELSLNPDQLLLRGATLRNTPWIQGIVVFTGHETKLMRNATATPIKRTDVERMLNRQIIMLVGILLVLSAISTVGDIIVRVTAGQKLTYLYYGNLNAAKQFFLDIFTPRRIRQVLRLITFTNTNLGGQLGDLPSRIGRIRQHHRGKAARPP